MLLEATGRGSGRLAKVLHAAQGEPIVEASGEPFAQPSKRTRADQEQAAHELAETGCGNGEVEPHGLMGRRRWRERLVQGVVSLAELLVDAGATDRVLLGPVAACVPGQGVQGELRAVPRRHGVGGGGGRPWLGSGGRLGRMPRAWPSGASGDTVTREATGSGLVQLRQTALPTRFLLP